MYNIDKKNKISFYFFFTGEWYLGTEEHATLTRDVTFLIHNLRQICLVLLKNYQML